MHRKHTRPMFQTADIMDHYHLLDEVAELVDTGEQRATVNEIASAITAESLRKARARIESGRTVGKLVVECWQ